MKFVLLMLFFVNPVFGFEKADLVVVFKSQHQLLVTRGHKILHRYHVVFGGNPEGHKLKKGDGRTPEGAYDLDYKNKNSSFYKALHISYPNQRDQRVARTAGVSPGGDVMIHGQPNGFGWLAPLLQRFNWTQGCIALTNEDMEELWQYVEVGTPIEIYP
jgi:murein L,D-transpeptidase YafK